MSTRFIYNASKNTGDRVLSKDMSQPKIMAEFYVRLFSYLNVEPEIAYEGYEFYIKDSETGKEFSAGLTACGPGYFSNDTSEELKKIVEEFDKAIFNESLVLKNCKIEIEHDFGKSILGFEDGDVIEIDLGEEE
jgi:hypothetical protein